MGDKLESDFIFPDIPIELLIEILICLPVKSLIRFTCVCKSWLYLIRSDHQFAMRHYLSRSTSFSKLMDNANLIIGNCDGWGTLSRSTGDERLLRLCMYSLTEKKTFRVEKKLEIGPNLNVCVSNFCNGIICIYVSSLFERIKGSRIFLYNPAIQELVTLPVSPRDHHMTILGLGFDSTSNDYKILAFFMHESSFWRRSYLVDVYSLRSGRWHNVHDIAPLEKFNNLTTGAPVLNANGRILNFMGYYNSKGETEGILTFDMIDEVFQEISMPESRSPIRVNKLLPSSRVRACLCRYPSFASNFRGHELYNVVDIWVLNAMTKEDQVWSKHATIRFPYEYPIYPLNVWMNDRELFVLLKKKGVPHEVFLYDLITHELKKTGRQGLTFDAVTYVESLVSVRELTSNCEPPNVGDDGGGGGGYLIREFSRINNVRWSHSFTLSELCD